MIMVASFFGANSFSLVMVVAFLSNFAHSYHLNDPALSSKTFSPSGILRVTEELPMEEELPNQSHSAKPEVANIEEDKSLTDEFVDILVQLSKRFTKRNIDEGMQADQGSFEEQFQIAANARLAEIRNRVLKLTGHTDSSAKDPKWWSTNANKSSYSEASQTSLPSIPLAIGENVLFIQPECKQNWNVPMINKNGMYVHFEVFKPSSSSDTVGSITSMNLQLFKMNGVNDNSNETKSNDTSKIQNTPIETETDDDDETEKQAAKYEIEERFKKAGVNISQRAVQAVVADLIAQDKKIIVRISKIRKKNNIYIQSKPLDSKVISAADESILTWNVTEAIKYWGNSDKKTISLLIEVEDEEKRSLPAKQFFKSECTANKYSVPEEILRQTNYKPNQINKNVSINQQMTYLVVRTKEIPASAAAFDDAAKYFKQNGNRSPKSSASQNRTRHSEEEIIRSDIG